ncbi:MAG TPA: NADPH-dependent FMN reductase [Gemmatimonadales bacterium]|nr:NADPH-dependent FMN reductase [Gemmatimonadales bacterium]
MKVLTISGSLRATSSNSRLLEAVGLLAPPSLTIVPLDLLGALPHFNPDLDVDPCPLAVRALREAVESADGMLISSPEYAHGVPGVLKNALDWLVSGVEIVGKPIGLLNASPRATHAQASLVETLTTMSANVVAGASVPIPLLGRGLDAKAIAADPALAGLIASALSALMDAIGRREAGAESPRVPFP